LLTARFKVRVLVGEIHLRSRYSSALVAIDVLGQPRGEQVNDSAGRVYGRADIPAAVEIGGRRPVVAALDPKLRDAAVVELVLGDLRVLGETRASKRCPAMVPCTQAPPALVRRRTLVISRVLRMSHSSAVASGFGLVGEVFFASPVRVLDVITLSVRCVWPKGK
jgi:hypothetical protein